MTTEARAVAQDQWDTNVFGPRIMADLATPQEFEERAKRVSLDDLTRAVNISHEPAQHAEWLNTYQELGADAVYLHHVGKDQQRFIEVFADRVLPQFR